MERPLAAAKPAPDASPTKWTDAEHDAIMRLHISDDLTIDRAQRVVFEQRAPVITQARRDAGRAATASVPLIDAQQAQVSQQLQQQRDGLER